MSTPVQAIPDRYAHATPYLACKGAADAIEFYKKAFGAREDMRMPMPDGRIGHAELTLGKSVIMLADEFPEMGFKSPISLGGSPVNLVVFVEDVDSFVNHAVASGASIVQPLTDKFYGDRSACLKDPFGHSWTFSTHKEEVSPEEMTKRAAAMFSGKQSC